MRTGSPYKEDFNFSIITEGPMESVTFEEKLRNDLHLEICSITGLL